MAHKHTSRTILRAMAGLLAIIAIPETVSAQSPRIQAVAFVTQSAIPEVQAETSRHVDTVSDALSHHQEAPVASATSTDNGIATVRTERWTLDQAESRTITGRSSAGDAQTTTGGTIIVVSVEYTAN